MDEHNTQSNSEENIKKEGYEYQEEFDKYFKNFKNKYTSSQQISSNAPAIVNFEIYDNDIKILIDINKDSKKTYDMIAGFFYLLMNGQLNSIVNTSLQKKLRDSDEEYEIFSHIIHKISEIKSRNNTEEQSIKLVVKPRDILNKNLYQPQQPSNLFGGF